MSRSKCLASVRSEASIGKDIRDRRLRSRFGGIKFR
jgi:hypothetical protein